MMFDSLREQAAVVASIIAWDEATEKVFFDRLNEAAAKNDAAGRKAAEEAAQANKDLQFASKARKAMDRAEFERSAQKIRFWLLMSVLSIAAIFPASSLAIMLGLVSRQTGAKVMCVGLLLMGAVSCMTVQAFWPRKRKARCL